MCLTLRHQPIVAANNVSLRNICPDSSVIFKRQGDILISARLNGGNSTRITSIVKDVSDGNAKIIDNGFLTAPLESRPSLHFHRARDNQSEPMNNRHLMQN